MKEREREREREIEREGERRERHIAGIEQDERVKLVRISD